MADIIAVTFDGADEAEATLRTIRALEAEGKIKPSDTAVVRKDQDGKVTLHNEAGSGTETGAAVGPPPARSWAGSCSSCSRWRASRPGRWRAASSGAPRRPGSTGSGSRRSART